MNTEGKFNKRKEKDEIERLKLKLEIEKIDIKRERSKNFSQNFSVFCKYIPWISLSIAIPVSIYFLAGKTTVFNSDFLSEMAKKIITEEKINGFVTKIIILLIILFFLLLFSIFLIAFLLYKINKKNEVIKVEEENRRKIENLLNEKEE